MTARHAYVGRNLGGAANPMRDDFLTALRLRRINPADPIQLSALFEELQAARRTLSNPIEAITAPIKATNRAQLPTWMPLPELLELDIVDPKIMPGSTANDLCKRYIKWARNYRDEETRPHNAIVSRQPGGAGTLITVRVPDFFAVYDRRAMRANRSSS